MGAKGSKAARAPAYPAGFPGAGYAAPVVAGAPAFAGAYPGYATPVAAPIAAPVGAYNAYPAIGGAYPTVGGLYDGLAPPSYSAYSPAGSFGPAAVIPPTVLQQPAIAPVVAAAPVAVAAPTQYQTVSPAFFQGLNTGVAYPYSGATGTFTVPPSPAAYSTFGAAPAIAPLGTTLY